jgi:hypothetical protein
MVDPISNHRGIWLVFTSLSAAEENLLSNPAGITWALWHWTPSLMKLYKIRDLSANNSAKR